MAYVKILSRKKTQEKEETAIKTGIHNSNLWEAQLNIMDLSRKHYRFENKDCSFLLVFIIF